MDNLDITQIAVTIADKVSSDLDIRIAAISAGGVILGALIAAISQWILLWWQDRPKKTLDQKREKILRLMLEDKGHEWRKIETLSRVIGADEEETKRLLINIGARGSENGENIVWALIVNKPLSQTEK